MVMAVSVVGVLVAARVEHQWLSVPFCAALTAALAGLLFQVSARAAFSIYTAWMVVGLLTVVSATKYRMKGFSLHFYDAVFLARDPDVYRFLLMSYFHLILPVLLGLALAGTLGVLLCRTDSRQKWSAPARATVLAALAVSVPLTFPAEATSDRHFYYMQGRHMSAFFVSLLDLRNLVSQADLEDRLEAIAPQPPFAEAMECGDTARLPDLFVVLQESQSDPADFPQIAGGETFLKSFSPEAGQPRPMFVESFGGGTWITNLSLMTGLSAVDFGWRSPYLTITLEKRVGGALPAVLAACGYRTAVLMPTAYTFVNEGPFLRSIGVETILDREDIGASSYHLRDDFYFRAAEAFIEKHRREDGRPLFLEIQTMFPHSPYHERMEPDLVVDGEPFSPDAEVNEYLRRLAIARGDFRAFLQARASDPAGRGSVVLEFGDHQSSATKPLVEELAGPDALGEPGSLAYRTFYAVSTFNYRLRRPMPERPVLDVAYLGASLLEAAGVPMSPMMADMIRLRDLCGGRFHACPDEAAVDIHLRRRADSGMLHLFPGAAPVRNPVAGRP